ncbi:DeoR/GlpR family DNA-binding transcription regulator [Dyadobacter frigoris]|uniref:DeoR/GlpR transcriptional regulator n=1 Tax=Dyadobacter frigoris TaxID=2576211 RepID=A0A4U6D3R8_9BACT|nr:DeoR/GlpR family DNA-binding transcription regulator [Dyadobacter frigoris]TKT90558.1 DeoR/GlpR transcriptional regulator [Dyadobacter frigoris]GLU51299.1 DeoR family transcriptional regulator [Dyadobacter frigoris]
MVREKRFNFILEKLRNNSEVGFSELSSDLNVSEDTIRRDIDMLADNGLLLKIRGGAIPRSHNPLSFKERIGHLQDDKEIIALKAQTLIKSGQTIFMDGGTSVYTLVSLLSTDIKLTVITNNTAIIPALSAYSGIELIVLGGHYLKESETIVGYQAIKMAENFQADLYFMGVCALDMQKGVTAIYMQEAELKKTMLEHSSMAIALSTFDKLETFEPYRVCPVQSLDYVITEMDSQNKIFEPYKKAGIKVL